LQHLGPEFLSSPSSSDTIKVKIYEINFFYPFLRVRNLVSHMKGRFQGLDWSRIGCWIKYVFAPQNDQIVHSWEKVHDGGNLNLHRSLCIIVVSKQLKKGNGRNMWYIWPRIDVHIEFWLRKQKGQIHLQDLAIHESIILKRTLKL